MNVLFVSHSSSTYGAENALMDLLEHSQNSVWKPIVVCPFNGPLVTRIRDHGIKVYVFPHFSWYSHNPGRMKSRAKAILHRAGVAYLRMLHNRHEFRLVYSNTLSSYVGALFAAHHRLPHIWHLHEFLGENIRASFDAEKDESLRWMSNISNKVIFNSETTKAAYAGWISDARSVVIPNGVPERFFDAFKARRAPASRSIFELAVIGKIIPVKRIEVAIEALALLRKTTPKHFHLSIVGDGDSRYIRSLQQTANHLGVSDFVAWHGYQEDPLPFYSRSDVVLINSHLETFCRSACEAMASGCPVIVSDTGEPQRFVIDGKSGFVYPEGNSEMLAEKIEQLASLPNRRDRIIQQAHEYANANWSLSTYSQRILSTIQGVVESGSSV
jgi:glycosyltransferase involved in cell wall biosynthesis